MMRSMDSLPKFCPICGLELQLRILLNKPYRSMVGHDECVKIMKEQDRIAEEEKRAIECREEMVRDLWACFDGSSIDPSRRSWEQWVENNENSGITDRLKGWTHKDKGLVLSGGPGIGKTHLLAAVAIQAFWEQGRRFKFIRLAEWADEIRSCSFERAQEMVLQLKRADIVFFDDLGAGIITDHIETKLTMILDHRLEFNCPTFFSTNLTDLDANKILSGRIMSRISGLCRWINVTSIKSDWRNK